MMISQHNSQWNYWVSHKQLQLGTTYDMKQASCKKSRFIWKKKILHWTWPESCFQQNNLSLFLKKRKKVSWNNSCLEFRQNELICQVSNELSFKNFCKLTLFDSDLLFYLKKILRFKMWILSNIVRNLLIFLLIGTVNNNIADSSF